nr:hypothetical protein [Rickettsia asembonensis]
MVKPRDDTERIFWSTRAMPCRNDVKL